MNEFIFAIGYWLYRNWGYLILAVAGVAALARIIRLVIWSPGGIVGLAWLDAGRAIVYDTVMVFLFASIVTGVAFDMRVTRPEAWKPTLLALIAVIVPACYLAWSTLATICSIAPDSQKAD